LIDVSEGLAMVGAKGTSVVGDAADVSYSDCYSFSFPFHPDYIIIMTHTYAQL
jgi:hypothetical protein